MVWANLAEFKRICFLTLTMAPYKRDLAALNVLLFKASSLFKATNPLSNLDFNPLIKEITLTRAL